MQIWLGCTTGGRVTCSQEKDPYKSRITTKRFLKSGIYLFSKHRSLWCHLRNCHPISWEPVLIYSCQNPRQQFDTEGCRIEFEFNKY